MSHHRYIEMTLAEKKLLIARLVHLVSVDEYALKTVESLLRNAEADGIFNGVSFDTVQTIENY